jgi:hypothetical protein
MSNLTGDSGAGGAASKPLLGQTSLLATYFQSLFGTHEWGAADAPPEYPSGPVPGSEGSLAARRLADPESRFWYSVMMAQLTLLPLCVAHNAEEKRALIAEIAQIVGLDIAVEKGWISGFIVSWRHGRFPTSPTGILVRAAPGRRTREQVLGSLEPHIRRFIKRSQGPPDGTVHVVGGRVIDLVHL